MADQANYRAVSSEEEEAEVKGRCLFGFMKKKEEEEEDLYAKEAADVLVTGVGRINIEEGDKKDEKKKDELKFFAEEEKKEEAVKVFEEEKKEEAVKVFEDEKFGEEKDENLLDKLHRSHSSSSSSSADEEEYEEVDGERRKMKKKKASKEKIKEKLHGGKKESGAANVEDATVVEEKVDKVKATPEKYTVEEYSSYKVEEDPDLPAPPEEKNSFLEKIKEKLHHHHKGEVETSCPPPYVVKESIYPTPAVEETTSASPAAEDTTHPSPAVGQETAYDYEAEKKVKESVYLVEATSTEERVFEESVHRPEECPPAAPPSEEGKKGFLEKIKEKLPGGYQHKKPTEEEEAAAQPAPPLTAEYGGKDQQIDGDNCSSDGKHQNKGIFGKIMEKLPGFNKSSGGGEEIIIKESEKDETEEKNISNKN